MGKTNKKSDIVNVIIINGDKNTLNYREGNKPLTTILIVVATIVATVGVLIVLRFYPELVPDVIRLLIGIATDK